MGSKRILQLYRALQKNKDKKIFSYTLKKNPLTNCIFPKRLNSISIEDGFFGDSGKGRVTAEFNKLLGKRKKLYSIRYNGGANAGHECYINGKQIVTHQLPMAIIQEHATAIIARGVLLHPEDLLVEIASIKRQFGGILPGTLIIDERVLLGLDTHRALETVLNMHTTGGRGSTGRGIATGYASLYLRIAVTLKDLLDKNWKETFREHYKLYDLFIRGFGKDIDLAHTMIATSTPHGMEKRTAGYEEVFLNRLGETRGALQQYVSPDAYSLLKSVWENPKIPITLEGAQGAGLDPYHGVYPDTTASRPMSRHINDATYNIIVPEEIAVRTAVIKTTYMSSVGQRQLPHKKDAVYEKWVQDTFDEKGRSTGRLRDIYPISIPIGQYLRQAAGYDYLVATHLDAAKKDTPITITTHYTDKKTGKEKEYLPYQDYLNNLDAHVVTLPSWDGTEVKNIKEIKDVPYEARSYLSFLSQTIAPVIFGTTDTQLGNFLSWLPL